MRVCGPGRGEDSGPVRRGPEQIKMLRARQIIIKEKRNNEMYDNKKKFRRSAVAVICYVLAALMLIYTCYQIGSTIHTINEYYAQYGMKATPVEYLTYVGQNAMTPLVNAVILFMLARVLEEVRKNNPANYRSDEEIVEAAEAKKAAKDTKKFEKGEKAAARAAEKSDVKASAAADSEEPVIVDFASADAEKPAEAKKEPSAKKSDEKSDEKKPAAKKSAARKPAAKRSADGKEGTKKAAAKKPAPKKKAAPKKDDAENKAEAEKQDNQEKQEKTEE